MDKNFLAVMLLCALSYMVLGPIGLIVVGGLLLLKG
jgi:hypothetical protein